MILLLIFQDMWVFLPDKVSFQTSQNPQLMLKMMNPI